MLTNNNYPPILFALLEKLDLNPNVNKGGGGYPPVAFPLITQNW